MSTVSYNPKSADRPYLPHAGIYGIGQEHEADVQLFSVALAEPGGIEAPFDDKQCERDSYTVWTFRIVYGGAVIFARSRAQANTMENMGSRNLPWLNNLGIQPTGEDEQGNPAYELDKLSGIKCSVKVAAPRKDKNDPSIFYTGSVVDVFGPQ